MSSAPPAEPFRLGRIALPAFGPTVLASLGHGAVLPVLALSARDLGASIGTAALVVALLGVGQLAGALPAGSIAARIGERRALLLAAGLELIAMGAAWSARGVWVLGAAVLLMGLAAAVFGLARQAYLTEVVPVPLRARALSTLGGMHRVGLFVGPFVGAVVVARAGPSGAFAVAMGASAAAFLLVLLLPDLTAHHDRAGLRGPRRSVWSVLVEHRTALATLGTGVLFIAAARGSRTTLLPLWSEAAGLSASDTSLVFGIAGAVDMLLFYPAGAVMDRFGRVWVAVPTVVVLGVGLAALPLTSSMLTVTLVALVMSVGNGIGSGIVMTLGADAAPPDARPQFLGGWRLFADFGGALGPLAVSAITAVAPLAVACVALGALAVASGGWLARWVPRYDPVTRRSARAPARGGPPTPGE